MEASLVGASISVLGWVGANSSKKLCMCMTPVLNLRGVAPSVVGPGGVGVVSFLGSVPGFFFR